jgi:hypothetical protein
VKVGCLVVGGLSVSDAVILRGSRLRVVSVNGKAVAVFVFTFILDGVEK